MMNVLNKIFKIVIFLIPFILIGCSSISSLSTTAFTLSVTELAAIKKLPPFRPLIHTMLMEQSHVRIHRPHIVMLHMHLNIVTHHIVIQ